MGATDFGLTVFCAFTTWNVETSNVYTIQLFSRFLAAPHVCHTVFLLSNNSHPWRSVSHSRAIIFRPSLTLTFVTSSCATPYFKSKLFRGRISWLNEKTGQSKHCHTCSSFYTHYVTCLSVSGNLVDETSTWSECGWFFVLWTGIRQSIVIEARTLVTSRIRLISRWLLQSLLILFLKFVRLVNRPMITKYVRHSNCCESKK